MLPIHHALLDRWWVLVVRGALAILFGILAFFWPGITMAILVLLFGLYALIDGVLAIALMLSGKAEDMQWWAFLIEGIMGIGAGLFTLAWPGITGFVLLIAIGAWAFVTGIFEIVAAIRIRKEVEGEWMLALSGIVSVLFGLTMLLNPFAGLLALVWLIGTYAFVFGVLLIALGFKLHSYIKEHTVTAV